MSHHGFYQLVRCKVKSTDILAQRCITLAYTFTHAHMVTERHCCLCVGRVMMAAFADSVDSRVLTGELNG